MSNSKIVYSSYTPVYRNEITQFPSETLVNVLHDSQYEGILTGIIKVNKGKIYFVDEKANETEVNCWYDLHRAINKSLLKS
jgi:hypothetical protein